MKKLIITSVIALCAGLHLAQAATEADIVAKEKATWEAWKSKDEAAFRKLVAPEYRESMSDRIGGLDDAIAGMKKSELKSFTLSDTKVVFPDPDTGVLTYTVTLSGTSGGKDISGTYNAGAVWRKKGADWHLVFYSEAEREDANAAAAQKKE